MRRFLILAYIEYYEIRVAFLDRQANNPNKESPRAKT